MATGWGRSTWGDGPFGATAVSVAVTGLAGTTALGNEASVTGDCNLTETGLAGTGAVGTIVASGFAIQGVSGTASTVGLGDETVTCDANIFPTNVVGTTAIGSVSTITDNILSITGLVGTTSLNGVTTLADANVSTTGVLATGVVNSNNLLVWGEVDTSQTSNFSITSTTQSPDWSQVA